MKQEDLRAARIAEARHRFLTAPVERLEMEHLADIYESNWTPPEPEVDADLLAFNAWAGTVSVHRLDREVSLLAYLAGCTRGRKKAKGLVEAVQWYADNLTAPDGARSYKATADAWRAVSAALASAKRGG